MLSKNFELIFVDEAHRNLLVAELLFKGQRLVQLEARSGAIEISFIEDKYLLKENVELRLPLNEFLSAIEFAKNELNDYIKAAH